MIIKCKMCGGDLNITENSTVAECMYCGTKQTLPKLDDEKKANLYDRANHFRRNNEFDKAAGIYEQILNEDRADAETYWSLVLCKYGIEYVEDPVTRKRVPTVNRAQLTSVVSDEDYKSAIYYADASQKMLYEAEAKAIDEIQKGILEISSKEKPFDVFICYKETDNNGRRTPDSVLATELYHELTRDGFKVFFSRITLEDKLGTAYEPYIFAALNSAKVMVVLGTKPEYFNAVWVKNEWARYLALIKNGAKKMLIPAYKDMDPYDLPEEFSHLQAQDMSKLGFMQDLVRGIKKIAEADTPRTNVVRETIVTSAGNASAEPLLKRAFMFLEDGKWQEADEYCEKVLDLDPECAMAYVGKLMRAYEVTKIENLAALECDISENENYHKAVRFAGEKLVFELKNYKLQAIYNSAFGEYNNAKETHEYLKAAESFDILGDFSDSMQKAAECRQKAEQLETERKHAIYQKGVDLIKKDTIKSCEEAIETLTPISDYLNTAEHIASAQYRIELIKKQKEAELELEKKSERKYFIAIALSIVVVFGIALLCGLYEQYFYPTMQYKKGEELIVSGNYEEAVQVFENLDNYKDSNTKISEIKYLYGNDLMNKGDYEAAITIFDSIINYSDANDKLNLCYYNYAKQCYDNKDYEDCITYCDKIKNFDKKTELYQSSKYNIAVQSFNSGKYSTAYEYFNDINGYKDSNDKKKSAMYQYVKANYNNDDRTTHSYLLELKKENYSDSAKLYDSLYTWKMAIITNNSEDDTTTNMTKLSKYDDWYFHYKLSGGLPGAQIYPKAVYVWFDGEENTYEFKDLCVDGGSGWFSTGFKNPTANAEGC